MAAVPNPPGTTIRPGCGSPGRPTRLPVMDPATMNPLLVLGCRIVVAGAAEDEVVAWLGAMRRELVTGIWEDADGVARTYAETVIQTLVAGHCPGATGDLASALAAEGFAMCLLDLARASFENHTVA